jgi:formylglycine-generating enzyme required for sulfatase activity
MQLPENFLQRTGYRLPTDAEWELVCRAASTQAYSCGDATDLLPSYAWFVENSHGQTWPVGTLKPNALGLFDMHGNVREWCHDKYNSRIEFADPGDLQPLDLPFENITRGGDFTSLAKDARSANRRGNYPLSPPQFAVGFRIARTLPR